MRQKKTCDKVTGSGRLVCLLHEALAPYGAVSGVSFKEGEVSLQKLVHLF